MRSIFLRRSADLNPATVFLAAAVGVCIVAGGSFYCGRLWQSAIHVEAARVEAAKPKRATPATWQGPLLSCKSQDVREYLNACATRKRMTAVGTP